ncbi:BgTH12-05246 [Blumeria graminis f. sp. triticale]|uniref:BgtE-5747 n=3 Tax=Blumeria graminis TaxID=34373 RepID=A0A061HDR6_BLUGR|nr:putative secreted effector protein [Blumeria graminis f. sp. tritici 96224]CAD6502656.1 BgTH12-05246 [Blumeria graminis f. sp. triticale]VDB88085.1 BgtE-5747 [Blumeria graminis f. sp. tritici]
MVCLLAILLYTGQELSQKDRLVITTSEDRSPSYGSYRVNYNQLFPVPGENSGIYRTLVDVDGPGTYITVYCSNKVSINDLWRFVSNGLTSLQGRLDEGFSNDEISESECLRHVNNLYFEPKDEAPTGGVQGVGVARPRPLPVAKIIRSRQCTERLLISLVYQQKILSANWYGFMTTYRDTRLPTIKFNVPVEIADAVLDSQFIMQKVEIDFEKGLAWNQGKLQLFRRESYRHFWMEQTLVGYEPYTGIPITEFIQANNAQVRNFMKAFTKWKCAKRCVPDCLRIRKIASLGLNACRKYRYEHLRVKVEKLVPVAAVGVLYGVKIRRPTKWPEEGFSSRLYHEFLERGDMERD